MTVKLTDQIARSIALPAGVADKVFFDDDVPNFGVRVRASGVRTWHVQYFAGRVRRMTLGPISAQSCVDARKAASKIMAGVVLGNDPAQDKREKRAKAAAAAADTIGAIVPDYLAHKRKSTRPRSYLEIERHIMQNAKPLHARPIGDIDRRAAAQFLAKFRDTPGKHNWLRSVLVSFYNWARQAGYTDAANPFQDTPKEAKVVRERCPTLDELAEIWRASDELGGYYPPICKLLMLTGCRRSEIADLRWSEINGDKIVIPGSRTKNRRPHEITLTPAMRAVLKGIERRDRDHVFGDGAAGFNTFGEAKRALDENINAARPPSKPMPAWGLHDFRRSMSTHLNELGVDPHVIEQCLGHAVGGVAAHYNLARYREAKARAWQIWNTELLNAVQGRPGKVVALRRR